ncbi:MAG: B12-binding domain-containing radical SAM protein [Syntrophomonas sp.]
MKVLLSTLNAKFIHSSLALAYLREFCQAEKRDIELKEFTINQQNEDIMAAIFQIRPDILAFSAYIWNIKPILQICRDYKQVSPHTIIILGGPEVSYDSCTILEKNQWIDYIVRGEGEETLKELLEVLYQGKHPGEIMGISYRDNGMIFENPDRPLISALDKIPFPYRGRLDYYRDRIIYYESSRGCPFNCSYCLSSTIKGVRCFSLPRVKEDLAYLISKGIKEVKFVDRTFNFSEDRARQIMEFILQQEGTSKFHFEVAAEIVSDNFLSFLKQVPPGRFDFEIGVQSTHPDALKAVRRSSNWPRLASNIKALVALGNMHIHLDLIAGLPFEDYDSFAKSFNDVYVLGADVIQLGFLKLLKGSAIRGEGDEHDYVFQSQPPYQVMANRYLSYGQILILKQVEDLLSRYYNSGGMPRSLSYIVGIIYKGQAFKFYEEFAAYWQEQDYFAKAHKKEAEYGILMKFIASNFESHLPTINELLKLDFLCNNQNDNLPRGILSHNPDNISEILYSILKNHDFISEFLPELYKKSAREIRRQVHLEYFRYDHDTKQMNKSPLPVLFVYDPVQKKTCRLIKVPSSYID